MILIAMVLAWSALAQASDAEPPDALRRFESARQALQTGVVEFTTEEFGKSGRRVRNATGRFAGRDVIWTDRGDEEGVIVRDENGAPSALHRLPIHVLKRRGEVWTHHELAISAEIQPASTRSAAPDPRTFGAGYAFSYLDLAETLWRDRVPQPAPRRYEQKRDGKLYVVSADSDAGRITWWIDPQRGWQASRVRWERDGLTQETRVDLARLDGVWFPERVEHYYSRHEDGRTPMMVVRVRSAEFNRDEHPRSFSPLDIGVVAGVTAVDRLDGAFNVVESGLADEAGFATPQEFAAREKARTPTATSAPSATAPKTEPTAVAAVPSAAELQKNVGSLRKTETEWEAYTRRFIAKYELDPEQTDQCWTICRSCQDEARAYLDRKREPLARIGEQVRRADQLVAAERERLLRQIDGELSELREPIGRIFEQRLKPRLDRIPTRVQRKSADSSSPEP